MRIEISKGPHLIWTNRFWFWRSRMRIYNITVRKKWLSSSRCSESKRLVLKSKWSVGRRKMVKILGNWTAKGVSTQVLRGLCLNHNRLLLTSESNSALIAEMLSIRRWPGKFTTIAVGSIDSTLNVQTNSSRLIPKELPTTLLQRLIIWFKK
jgi:hypothetical protein